MQKPDVTIRPLTLSDQAYFSDAIELLNRTQGRGLFSADYLANHVQDTLSFVVAGFYEFEIVAIGVAQVIQNFDYYLPFDSEIQSKLSGKIVGKFATLCAREDWQGQGLGQRISHQRLNWLKAQNCDVVLGVSWVSGLKHTSDRVFEKTGFKAVKKVEDFYSVSPSHVYFDCPACATVPCRCPVVLYIWERASRSNFQS